MHASPAGGRSTTSAVMVPSSAPWRPSFSTQAKKPGQSSAAQSAAVKIRPSVSANAAWGVQAQATTPGSAPSSWPGNTRSPSPSSRAVPQVKQIGCTWL